MPVAADAIGTDFLQALGEDAQTRETQLDDDLEGQPRDALATAGAPEAAVKKCPKCGSTKTYADGAYCHPCGTSLGAVLPGSGESGAPP